MSWTVGFVFRPLKPLNIDVNMKKIVTNLKRFFLGLIIPIQKLLQRTGRQEAKITEEAVQAIMDMAEPGDILLCYESGRPTSRLIKGIYDHAVILGFNDKIVEAVGDRYEMVNGIRTNVGGVRAVSFIKWLYQIDGVALIRPSLPRYIREAASKNALKYIGWGYDYKFEHGPETIYCSELEYISYRTEDRNFMSDIKEDDEILPQDYRDRCDKDFILIYEFKGGKYA